MKHRLTEKRTGEKDALEVTKLAFQVGPIFRQCAQAA